MYPSDLSRPSWFVPRSFWFCFVRFACSLFAFSLASRSSTLSQAHYNLTSTRVFCCRRGLHSRPPEGKKDKADSGLVSKLFFGFRHLINGYCFRYYYSGPFVVRSVVRFTQKERRQFIIVKKLFWFVCLSCVWGGLMASRSSRRDDGRGKSSGTRGNHHPCATDRQTWALHCSPHLIPRSVLA